MLVLLFDIHSENMSKLVFLFLTPEDLMKKSPPTDFIRMQQMLLMASPVLMFFLGMKSACINVYGHRPGGDGFFNCYKDFSRDHGVPSALRRDNAMEMKSEKVLAFQREYLIKDEFSEVNNQQQNVVERGGI